LEILWIGPCRDFFDVDQTFQVSLLFIFGEFYSRKDFSEIDKMADESENRIEPTKPEDGVAVSQVEENTAGNVVKVDSYRDEHHINLTWRSWMVVL
jgi:hypothetical protein